MDEAWDFDIVPPAAVDEDDVNATDRPESVEEPDMLQEEVRASVRLLDPLHVSGRNPSDGN